MCKALGNQKAVRAGLCGKGGPDIVDFLQVEWLLTE